jgi:hypothetical protein
MNDSEVQNISYISGYVKGMSSKEVLIGASVINANTKSGTTTNQYRFFRFQRLLILILSDERPNNYYYCLLFHVRVTISNFNIA